MSTLEEKIAVMQAAAAGKGIQSRPAHSLDIWREAPEPTWDWRNWEYRVSKTKKTGWINIYKPDDAPPWAGKLHFSKEVADSVDGAHRRVACVEVVWEE